jgi:hypothetical protein
MSEEGSCEDGAEGLLPESDVLNLMRRMQDMNLPVSPEEIQVRRKRNVTLVFCLKVTIVRFYCLRFVAHMVITKNCYDRKL